MNYYCIVEGKTEKRIYPKWIKYQNPLLKIVNRIEDINENCVFIISGCGYPYIFEIINNAIQDMRKFPVFNKFVISIDAELNTVEEKEAEVREKLDELSFREDQLNVELVIIVQNYCLESWALGHRKIFRRRTTNPELREFQQFYDVKKKNPELMPGYPPKKYSKVEFSYKYLTYGIRDLYTSLTYSKANPRFIGNEHYFRELISRYEETNHISSFGKFLDTFSG